MLPFVVEPPIAIPSRAVFHCLYDASHSTGHRMSNRMGCRLVDHQTAVRAATRNTGSYNLHEAPIADLVLHRMTKMRLET